MTQNNVLARCDKRCGRNWHHFCAKAECQYFNEMMKHSSAKAGFLTIGDEPKKGKSDD